MATFVTVATLFFQAEEVVGKSQKPGNSEEAQGGTSKQGEQSK